MAKEARVDRDPPGQRLSDSASVGGTTLMLPVSELGALPFAGEGHAREGDGEVVGNALELQMVVEFRVDLVKNRGIGRPRVEPPDYVMPLVSASPRLQAWQDAIQNCSDG